MNLKNITSVTLIFIILSTVAACGGSPVESKANITDEISDVSGVSDTHNEADDNNESDEAEDDNVATAEIDIDDTNDVGDENTTGGDTGQSTDQARPYILGADISSLAEYVDKGAVFVDTDGAEKPLIRLLKNHGFNYIRLRTFVDPYADYGYATGFGQWCEAKAQAYNDKAHIINMAQQVKAAGMKLLLDFHYSDTWADPSKQVIPHAWRNVNTIEDLASEVEDYTTDVLNAMKLANVLPDMVQIGNEITPGMLIHVPTINSDCYGNQSIVNDVINGSRENWGQLAILLKAGINAVRTVNNDIPVMLHIENTADTQGVVKWVNNALENNVDFDVLGLSAYERWQGPSSQWQDTLNLLAETYTDLNFSFVEYNPQGRLVNDIMFNLRDQRGLGTFFWEPILSGEWGPSMFHQDDHVYTAKPKKFAVFDNIVKDYGL